VVERINPDVPSIRIDPVHLHQMLTNLVINARDATGGEGHIEVGLRRSRFSGEASGEVCVINHLPVRGEFVELYVKDDGSGIAADALPKIFDPFFTTKEVGKGSGMGLAMVLGILRENDGHVLVQTRTGAGHGTCFRLLFQPVAGVAPVPAELPAAPPVAAAGGRQILVVDDEAPLGRLLGEVLEANGYQATVLANPRAALVAFRADPDAFHAVITDQTMPRMTGLELTHELLAINPKLPVFMVSGYSDKVDAESARHHGVRRFFHKPVDQAALLEALREV
jgi:CheY-like chemotaxis protein